MMFGLFEKKHKDATMKSLNATAYQMGCLAKRYGMPKSSNPYKGGAYGFNAWLDGWEQETKQVVSFAALEAEADPTLLVKDDTILRKSAVKGEE